MAQTNEVVQPQAQSSDEELKVKIPLMTRLERDRGLLEPINHGLAASSRKALELGVSAHVMVEMLLNHTASVVGMIEPPAVRAKTVEQVMNDFANMVRRHVDARHMTKGGIIVPEGER